MGRLDATNVMTLGAVESQGSDESLELIEAHGVGTWTWLLDAGEVIWSPGMSRILGIEHLPQQQSLEQYEKLVHPDDRPDFSNPSRAVASAIMNDREYRVLRPNGEMRWVRSYGRLIHSRDGRPERLVGVAFDVTETRQALVALNQRDGLTGALRELFDVVIWSTDADGQVRDEIQWWQETGQRGRVDNWNRLGVVHPDDRQKVRDAWEQALRNRRRYAVACRVMVGDRYIPVISRASAVLGRHGAIDSWIGFTVRQDANFAAGLDLAREETPPLLPGQVRAARGYLGWSAEQLAEHAGVSFSTVRRVETPGERGVREQSVAAIRTALERAGITFTTGSDGRTGVSLKPAES